MLNDSQNRVQKGRNWLSNADDRSRGDSCRLVIYLLNNTKRLILP